MNIIMASSRNHPHNHRQSPSFNTILPQPQHSHQQPQQSPPQQFLHQNQQVQYRQQQPSNNQQQYHQRQMPNRSRTPNFHLQLPSIGNHAVHNNQKNFILSSNTTTSPDKPTSPLDFTDKIPFHELKLSTETLGSGSFGTVFKGRWRNRTVAVKQFRTREEIDSFLVEVKQLSCVKHPNIVTLFGASTLSDTAYLVMEYAEGGSLNRLLHECKQQHYELRHACVWAMQTARGVAYLHSIRPKPIMHRDLKPANLLLFQRGKILKICDFGTACTVKTQMTNNTGSAAYMAPEVFATSSYLESGDVFSWSIIFWEILARRHPYAQQYSNPYQILWSVKQANTRPNELLDCPEPIWNLITQCWHKDPKARPTMQQVAKRMEFIYSLTDSHENLSLTKQHQQQPQPTTTNQSQLNLNNRQDQSPNHMEPPNGSHLLQHSSPLKIPLFADMPQLQQLTSDFRWSSIGGSNSRGSSDSRQMQSPNSYRSRALCNRLKALTYHYEMLRSREKKLQNELSYQRQDKSDITLEELKELRRETKSKRLIFSKRGTQIL